MNRVVTVFEGEASDLFATADKAEARVRSYQTTSQQSLTQTIAAAEKQNTRVIEEEGVKRVAAARRTAAEMRAANVDLSYIKDIPITYRPGDNRLPGPAFGPPKVKEPTLDPTGLGNPGLESLQRMQLLNRDASIGSYPGIENFKRLNGELRSVKKNSFDAAEALSTVERKQHSLFDLNSARPFQGLGAGFRATGLTNIGLDETVVNVLAIAAQKSGLVKINNEGAALAAKRLAASEAEYVNATTAALATITSLDPLGKTLEASALRRANAELNVANAAKAAAVAQAESASSVTVLGASIPAIVGGVGAVVAALYLAHAVSKDIREEAEKHLRAEEAIQASINKSAIAARDFKDSLATQERKSVFDRSLQTDDLFGLQFSQAAERRQHDQAEKEVRDEKARRGAIASALGFSEKVAKPYIDAADTRDPKELKEQEDEIAQRAQRILQLQAQVAQASKITIQEVQQHQIEAQNRTYELFTDNIDKENAALRSGFSVKEALLKGSLARQDAGQFESIRKTTDLKNQLLRDQIASERRNTGAALDSGGGSLSERYGLIQQLNSSTQEHLNEIRVNNADAAAQVIQKLRDTRKELTGLFKDLQPSANPYDRIFADGAAKIERVKDATKALTAAQRDYFISLAQGQTVNERFGQRVDDHLAAANLNDRAQQFRRGVNDAGYRSSGQQSFAEFVNQKTAERLFEIRNQYATFHDTPYASAQDIRQAAKAAFVRDFTEGIENRRLQERLDQQFNALPRAANEDQRHQVDERIAQLSQGVDPSRLRGDQNSKIAEALDNEARRRLAAEQAAIARQEKQIGLVESIYNILERQFGGHDAPSAGKAATSEDNSGSVWIEITNRDPEHADVSHSPGNSDVNRRYPRRR